MNSSIENAIQGCEYEENFNYRDLKHTDWPAFQASGYKTVKRFEAEFVLVGIYGVNEKNFSYEMSSPDFGEFALHLKVIVIANEHEFGKAVQFLVNRYMRYKNVT